MSDYANEVPDESEQLDQIQQQDSLDDRGVEDVLDEGYTPPEQYSSLIRRASTRLWTNGWPRRMPEPDPYAEVGGQPHVRDELENIDDGEVGDRARRPAGRPERRHRTRTPTRIWSAMDVGIDGAAASAEEAAVHIVPDDEY